MGAGGFAVDMALGCFRLWFTLPHNDPSDTSVVSSTTVGNSSREYCLWRCASNTSSTQPTGSACSSTIRAITPARAAGWGKKGVLDLKLIENARP